MVFAKSYSDNVKLMQNKHHKKKTSLHLFPFSSSKVLLAGQEAALVGIFNVEEMYADSVFNGMMFSTPHKQ